MSSGGCSSGKGFGGGRGKGVRKGPPIVWEGSLGPDSFEEPIEEFPHSVQYVGALLGPTFVSQSECGMLV